MKHLRIGVRILLRDKYACFLTGVQRSSVGHSASYSCCLVRYSRDKAGWCVKSDTLHNLVSKIKMREQCFISTRNPLLYLYCLMSGVCCRILVFLQNFKIKGSLVSIIDPFVNPREDSTPFTDIQSDLSDLYSPITTCNCFEI